MSTSIQKTRDARPHRRTSPRPDIIEKLEERVLLSRAIGIDVASYQGDVNWADVYSSGRTFAWTKATEGTSYTNPTYTYNATNANGASIEIGPYHFARYDTGNSATAEADYFISVAGSTLKPGYLRPMLDVEHSTSMSKTALSNWVNAWCNRVLSRTGCRPIVYTYTSFASAHLNSTVTQWALDMASYNGQNPYTGNPSSTTPWSGWNFWQYGDAAYIPGVGSVDADVAHGTQTGYVIPSYTNHSSLFSVGQTVHVSNAPSGLKAWNTYASNGTYVVEPNGKTGVIKGGPVFMKGYERWEVQYSGDSALRWSAQDWLAAGSGSSAPATVAPTADPVRAPKATFASSASSPSSAGSLFSSKSIKDLLA